VARGDDGGHEKVKKEPRPTRRAVRAGGGLEGGLVDGMATSAAPALRLDRLKVMVGSSGARRGMEIAEIVECRS
jgi:hypothetical protein